MPRDTKPGRKARLVALPAMVLVLVGGLSLLNQASGDAEPPTAVATSCSRFETDAHKLFVKGDTAALSGTFAPGDHVHLVIYFPGAKYSWKLTGVLAMANKAHMTGSGQVLSVTRSVSTDTSTSIWTTTTTSLRSFGLYFAHEVPRPKVTPTSASTSTVTATSHGDISGLVRLEMDFDVATAGDGAITINTTGGVSSFIPPRVTSASCNAAKTAQPLRRDDASS
jgi:hypothetical protein